MTRWTEFKDFMLPRKAITASPEVIEALHERTVSFSAIRAVNQQVAYQADAAVAWGYADYYEKSPAVRTVVDLIGDTVAQLDLRLYEEVGMDEREEQSDHPAMESLRHPNPAVSSDHFVRLMVKSFLLSGNAFAIKLRNTPASDIRQFVFLPFDRMKVRGPGLTPTSYVIWNFDGTETTPIPADDILHWRSENFTDMRIGLSRLDPLRAVIVEEAAMQAQMIELAKSGMAEPVWISRPTDAPDLSQEGLQRLEEYTANRLKNAYKVPPMMEEGMRLEGFGISPKDAEALAVRKYALQQIATAYQVPLGMVGLEDNVEEARAEFYSDCIPTICEAFCRQLNRSVLVDEYGLKDYYYEFDLDSALAGDERLKALTSAAGVPPLTRNEARARINLPKVEGGDEPMTPANMTPGSDPEKLLPQNQNPPGSKPSNDVMPIQNPAGPDQGGGAREGEPGVRPQRQSLTEALLKHYERVASSGNGDTGRWNRELMADLEAIGLNGDAGMLAAAVNGDLVTRLADPTVGRAEVFNHAKAEAPKFAARLELTPEEMKGYGLPDEAIWRRLGYSEPEIDQMRALKLAEDLASDG